MDRYLLSSVVLAMHRFHRFARRSKKGGGLETERCYYYHDHGLWVFRKYAGSGSPRPFLYNFCCFNFLD